MKKLGLYVHIPFCKSKCLYCDFNSFSGKEGQIATYFSALKKEIAAWGKKLCDREFDTIYFGGGTPSYVGAELLGDIISKIQKTFNIDENPEITVECNPGTIDSDGLRALKCAGVNRLSIGLQSEDNCKLKFLGRIHSFEDFKECYSMARLVGFDNISLDLMYGLPNMTMDDWVKTINMVVGLGPEHISAYALKVEDGTPFSKMDLKLPDEDACADMYECLVEKLRTVDYCRYEISNFSKKGKESRHNQKYWELTDFLGVGAGAFSCLDGVRFSNFKGIEEYVEKVDESGFAVEGKNEVSAREQMSEFIFLGLRCERGVSFSEFEQRYGRRLEDVFGDMLKKYSDMGFLIIGEDRVRFSDKAFFVSNTILSDFV